VKPKSKSNRKKNWEIRQAGKKKSLPFVIQGNNTRPKKKYLARWRLMGILFSGSIIMDRVVLSKNDTFVGRIWTVFLKVYNCVILHKQQ